MKLLTLLFIILISACTDGGDDGRCPDTNCADYATQAAAQAALEADPECRGDLDGDNDGKACEDYWGSSGPGSGCPTTANCGCSNKRKDECASTCCQWITGDGCKCK